MPRRVLIATAVALLITCMPGSAGPASAAAKKVNQRACTEADAVAIPTSTTLPRAYDAILCLINRERARRRASPLRSSGQLTRAAAGHSTDMIARQYFAHESPDGATPRQRVLRAGYFRGRAAGTVKEALAIGWAQLSTPHALVASLMRAASHRSILLSRRLRDVGIGLILGAPQPAMAGGVTLTLDFARR